MKILKNPETDRKLYLLFETKYFARIVLIDTNLIFMQQI